MSAADPDDVEYAMDEFDGLSDEDLAALAEELYGPAERDPLDIYATPVTRRRKPSAVGREVHDLPPL